MKPKNNHLKYIAVIVAVALIIISALLLLDAWEKKQNGDFVSSLDDDTITYQGQEYIPKDNIETFLAIGLDRYKDSEQSDSHQSGSVQADFLMLFVFDNQAKKTTAIHINRDTVANVNRLDINGNVIETEKKQIALAYNYEYDDFGIKNCRNTADSVSDLLLDIDVHHYISLTMDSVVKMNDLVGGVEVTVLDDFTGIDDTLVKGEKVTLMGEQALRYVRTRYGLEDSTNSTRMARQQQYISALFNKTNSRIKSDDEFVLTVAEKIKPYVTYDSTEFRLKELANKFNDYEFVGIREIDGEAKRGENFMEFYPYEDSILNTVIELFYTPNIEK